MERQLNNGWITVNEKLPVGKEYEILDEDGDILHKHVLCLTDNKDIPITVGFHQDGDWFASETYNLMKVIAWQSLPEAQIVKE